MGNKKSEGVGLGGVWRPHFSFVRLSERYGREFETGISRVSMKERANPNAGFALSLLMDIG